MEVKYTHISGGSDAFITKLDPSGSTLSYSTYLGGSRRDDGLGIAVDDSENVYITGITKSIDFPTKNPYQAGFAGGFMDTFITKLSDDSGLTNTPPTAVAGTDQSVVIGDVVTLDGSGSYDLDNDTITYSWSFTSVPSGSNAALSDTTIYNLYTGCSRHIYCESDSK